MIVPLYTSPHNELHTMNQSELDKYMRASTAHSGVPLKIKNKAVLRRIAQMLK